METITQEKPSQMIRFALEALREAEEPDAKVKPDMGTWHEIRNGQCFACLGGLAANKRFGFDPNVDLRPTEYISQLGKEIYNEANAYENALNAFRLGNVVYAFNQLSLQLPKTMDSYRVIVGYNENRELFHQQMNELASDLEASGC